MKLKSIHSQAGASMVEILVTIVIVATGLLGVAGLQTSSMRYLKTANQRSEATQAAYDISERMRSNGLGVIAGNYLQTASYTSQAGSMPSVPTCTSALCSPSDVANKDKAEWQRALASRLNGGAGYIVTTNVAGKVLYDVIVMWKEPGYSETDPACPQGNPPAPGAGVRCFSVRFTP
ncbi:MAG: type IV pilus modification protein PilV [Burkholderiales bacterium]|nr:type IV pilus modification protein PilV [Burkholderiales bacterium]